MENYSSSEKVKENLNQELNDIFDSKENIIYQLKELEVTIFY